MSAPIAEQIFRLWDSIPVLPTFVECFNELIQDHTKGDTIPLFGGLRISAGAVRRIFRLP